MVDPNANRVDIGIPVLIVGAGPAGLTGAGAHPLRRARLDRGKASVHRARRVLTSSISARWRCSGLSSTTPETTTHQSGKAGLTANRPSVTVTRARDRERPVLILMAKWWSDRPGRRHGNVQPRRPTATELCAGGVRPPNWTWGTRRCRGAAASFRCATSTCSGLRSATR